MSNPTNTHDDELTVVQEATETVGGFPIPARAETLQARVAFITEQLRMPVRGEVNDLSDETRQRYQDERNEIRRQLATAENEAIADAVAADRLERGLPVDGPSPEELEEAQAFIDADDDLAHAEFNLMEQCQRLAAALENGEDYDLRYIRESLIGALDMLQQASSY